MTTNHVYNLMQQLVIENKSLWRIKENYMKDMEGCSDCKAFWEKMVADKESHVKELEEMVKKHL